MRSASPGPARHLPPLAAEHVHRGADRGHARRRPAHGARGRGVAGVLVVAHRGASAGAVDNSLDAFEQAIALGADMIEFDVRRTRDDQLIAFHDAAVGGRAVEALTRTEIGEATGHLPPLLDEVLALTRGRIGLDVELKEDGYVARVLAALDGIEDVVVTSFLDDVVAEAKRRAPEVRGRPAGRRRPHAAGRADAALRALARAASARVRRRPRRDAPRARVARRPAARRRRGLPRLRLDRQRRGAAAPLPSRSAGGGGDHRRPRAGHRPARRLIDERRRVVP